MRRLAMLGPVLLMALGAAAPALAKGGFFPTYHPKPCVGDECRGDDPRSGQSCQGLICGFVPSKAMQPPVTAAQAAEAERARAAAAAAAAEPAPAPPPAKASARPAKPRAKARAAVKPAAPAPEAH